MRSRVRALLGSGTGALILAVAPGAGATAGTHAPAVSTYDTRASSIVFAYRHGFSSAGSFNTFSYNANFTSTSGRLSAQFGVHYVNFLPTGETTRAHGVAGSGVAVLEFPVTDRYLDGVPKAALALHLGGVPTAYISGQRNFLTLPLVLGFGVPLSPARAFTLTPWYELALSANVDTVIKPEGVTIDTSSVQIDPATGTASLPSDAVQSALEKGVTIDVGVSVPMRVGLSGELHLGKSVDLDLYGMLSTLGGAFSGTAVKTAGASLVIRWDDIVPAVLPPAPAAPESCEATERRFRACPNSRYWLSPEQRGRAAPAATPSSAAPRTAPRPAPVAAPPRATAVPAPPAPSAAPPSASPAPAPSPQAPARPDSNGSFPE